MLLGNMSRWYGLTPGKFMGAGGVGTVELFTSCKPIHRMYFTGTGLLRASQFKDGEVTSIKYMSSPAGNSPPVAWHLSVKAGGIQVRQFSTSAMKVGLITAKAAEINISSSSSFDLSIGAIVEISATLSCSSVASIGMKAAAKFSAPMSMSSALTLRLGALEGMTVFGDSGSSMIIGLSAIGSMGVYISPFSPLSPEGLAKAVWDSIAANNNNNGTMGSKLNSASAGGSLTLSDIEASIILAKQSGFNGLATSIDVSDAQLAILEEVDAIKVKTDTLVNTDLTSVNTSLSDIKGTGFDTTKHSLVKVKQQAALAAALSA